MDEAEIGEVGVDKLAERAQEKARAEGSRARRREHPHAAKVSDLDPRCSPCTGWITMSASARVRSLFVCRIAPLPRFFQSLSPTRGCHLFRTEGEIKCSTPFGRPLRPDAPAVAVNDALHGRQAYPGALELAAAMQSLESGE